jgi:hypothetical protein
MKSINCKLLIMAVLIFEAVCNSVIATPDISIETYQDWINEIGPDGHITAVPTWSSAGLEDIYPGESAAFVVPTLSALMDDEGEPALEMDFGSGIEGTSVIGGIEYLYDEDPDYTGVTIGFSVKRLKPGEKEGEWRLLLTDHFGRKCSWTGEIDFQEKGEAPWYDVPIDVMKNGEKDTNFDIKKVYKLKYFYKGSRAEKPGEGNLKGKIDHLIVKQIPEPASLCLLSLGMIGLFGGRKQRA